MQNASIKYAENWTEDIDGAALEFTEMIRQEYTNCCFSAGMVEGHPIDTLYLKLEKAGKETLWLMRPDEFAAIAWCITGVLWSDALAKLPPET